MKTGRKRKANVRRDKNGKSRGEIEIVHPETLAVRRRDLRGDGIDPEQALNALAGFTLGRLYLRHQANPQDPGAIDKNQYEAGEAWQKIVHRHAAMMGYKLHIHTPSFVMVGNGMDCRMEPDDDQIMKLRRRFEDCYNSLMAACADHGIRVRDVTYGVAVENWPASSLSEKDYGQLRIGLNAIGRVLK